MCAFLKLLWNLFVLVMLTLNARISASQWGSVALESKNLSHAFPCVWQNQHVPCAPQRPRWANETPMWTGSLTNDRTQTTGYSTPLGSLAFYFFPFRVYHCQAKQRTGLLNVNVIGFFQWMNTKAEHPRVTWNSPQLAPGMPFLLASKNATKASQHTSRIPTGRSLTRTVSEVNRKRSRGLGWQSLNMACL